MANKTERRSDGSQVSRKAERFDVREVIRITLAKEPATIVDLSSIGMCIETSLKLIVGSRAEIFIGKLLFCVEVMQAREIKKPGAATVFRIGAKFTTVTTRHREVIQQIIDNRPGREELFSGYDAASVVLVNSDSTDRFMFWNVLATNDIRVMQCEKFSREIINSIKKHGALAVACDYVDQETTEVLNEIRGCSSKLPIMVLTYKPDPETIMAIKRIPATYCYRASYNPNKFLRDILDIKSKR